MHDTASIYGAIWGSPLSLTDAFANGGLMLREGAIDDIYPKMIEEENIHVKYNYEVEVGTYLLQIQFIGYISLLDIY